MSTDGDNAQSDESISEINARIPRRVYYDGTSVKVLCGMLFVIFAGAVWAAWVSYGAVKNTHLHRILRRDGSMITGFVTRKSIDHNNVYVRYRFLVDAVPYFGQAEMKTDHYMVPQTGEQIEILYLPSDPRVSQPTNWEWFSAWDIFRAFYVLLAVAIAAVILGVGLRQRRLARMGVVVEGTVTACVPEQKLFKVYYEFTTEEKEVAEGSSEVADEHEVGASIRIVYLRGNPKRNDRYPVAGFRIVD